jgi:hypothetical protein
MNQYRLAFLLILIAAFSIASQNARAQLAPANALPHADAPTVLPPSRPLYPSPILAYTRPTEKEKLRLFAFDAFGPYSFAKAAASAGFQQGSNSPPEWGGGWDAYGERLASNIGVQLVTTTTSYGLAEILREDAAYYRCECTGFLPRIRHALISTFTARRGQDGHRVFSIPGLVSPYVGSMAALAWYPDRFGIKDGFRMGNYNLATQAAGNVAMEFIYGGPHTMFRHLGRSNSPGGTVAAAENQ